MKRSLYTLILVTAAILFVGGQDLHAQIISKETTPTTQESPNKPDKQIKRLWKWDNVFIGGIPGFGLSNTTVSFNIAVEAGYFIHPRFALGARFNYLYYRDKYYDFNFNIFGGGPFARGYIWKGIFGQIEYEMLSVGDFRVVDSFGKLLGTIRVRTNAFLVGGGYHGNYKEGFGYYAAILFNVLQTETFIYPNPSIRIGLTYKFSKGDR